MKILTVCAILLLRIAAISAIAEPIPNMIQDEFFDQQTTEQPSNWAAVFKKSSAGKIKIINSDSYAGKENNCLEIQVTDLPDTQESAVESVYKYKLVVHQGIWYSFAGAIKTEQAASGSATKLVVRYPKDHQSKPGREIRIIYSLPGETNWQTYNTSFEVPSDTNEVEVALVRCFTKGKAWLDAVYLQTSYYASADLMISSSKVRQGESFELRGAGYEPLKKLAFWLDNKPFAQDLGIIANGKGYFEVKLIMPHNAELGIQGLRVKTENGSTTAFDDDIAVEVLAPLEPKIIALKMIVLKSNGALKTFPNNEMSLKGAETLVIMMTGETGSEYKASFYIPGVTADMISLPLADAELGIYRAMFKPVSARLDITSRVIVKLKSPTGQTNVRESQEVYFKTLNRISLVSVDKTILKIGEKLSITLLGEPNQKANCRLSNTYFTSAEIPLQEEPSGVYKGLYEPPSDIEAKNLLLVGNIGSDEQEALDRITIDTKKPGLEISIDKPQGYKNGETVWIFVETSLDVVGVSADVSMLDTTKSVIKFNRDSVRPQYFVSNFIISTENKAFDGEKRILISAVDLAGNTNSKELAISLNNQADDAADDGDTEQSIELNIPEGLNILSIPLNPGEDWTLAKLAEIECLGDKLIMVTIANDGRFDSFFPPFSDLINKKAELGIGYIILMAKNKTAIFKGKSWGTKAAPAMGAVSAVPDDWVRPIIQAVEALPWSQSRQAALQILYRIKPPETALLQNFPNPFNPETWIPFQLKETADVMIEIYNAKGCLVRSLALGRCKIGAYHNRVNSGFWDGKNQNGEKVSSGVYFYTLKAGYFIATKKMLVLK